MRVSIGSDHAGLALKAEVTKLLQSLGLEIFDRGPFNEGAVDYPDFAELVCRDITKGTADKGILICGTGIGMSIAANKHPGIRAALCHDTFSARATREHNDSNILCLGQRVVGVGLALDIVSAWVGTDFVGGKHKARLDKIAEIERRCLMMSNC